MANYDPVMDKETFRKNMNNFHLKFATWETGEVYGDEFYVANFKEKRLSLYSSLRMSVDDCLRESDDGKSLSEVFEANGMYTSLYVAYLLMRDEATSDDDLFS